jgi:hypothetical protein
MNTAVNWVAYKVWKENFCDPDELIGYYQTRQLAEQAKQIYITKTGITEKGICCHNSKDVHIDEILVETSVDAEKIAIPFPEIDWKDLALS